jgi:hypothetical protein
VRIYLALFLVLLSGVRFEPAPRNFPSYEDLWISKDTLVKLARYHGTMALKITEKEALIWRDARWIPILKRKKI